MPLKSKISDLVILLTTILFPIGLLLLIIRFVMNAKYRHLRAGDYRVTGYCFLVWLVFISILMISDPSEGAGEAITVFLFVLGVPALIFLWVGRNKKKEMERLYDEYNKLIELQSELNVNHLSTMTGLSVDDVAQDLRYMLMTGRLVHVTGKSDSQTAAAPSGPVTVQCGNCGASDSVVPGKSKTCEYCGSTLTA
ncbi:hypothetical protein ABEV74_21850 [Paenibacillus cisolokensis]|uniref:hypothetical protein n=1 Tax=Paenibacillus cisolokensis TaxID=1658519 RepID=UPI003D2E8F1A